METEKKKPNWKKIVVVAMAVVLLLVVGAIIWTETLWHCVVRDVFGKETTQVTDCVRVYVSMDLKDDFYAEKFTEKDFKCVNVKEIKYEEKVLYEDEESTLVSAFILVYLKNPGEYQCKKAILRLRELDSVKFPCVTLTDAELQVEWSWFK